jgi:hypothetical protein
VVRGKLSQRAETKGRRVLPHDAPRPNWDDYPPIFSFDHMVASHSIDTCDEREKSDLTDAIWKRSRVSWRDLRSSQRHGLGAEKIRTINHPLPAVVTET